MASSWLHRRGEIDSVLPDIAQVVQSYLKELDGSLVRKRVTCENTDTGYLIDIAEHARIRQGDQGAGDVKMLLESVA